MRRIFLLSALLLMESTRPPKSPCIGVCSTGIGDSVCRGCKRYLHEVVNWNSYSPDEKRAVLDRISQLAEQVLKSHVEIVDRDKLCAALSFQQIRFDENSGPYLWLLELLKMGATQIRSLDDFGCRLRRPDNGSTLESLRLQLDSDFYELSCAHYQRYFEQSHR